MRDGHHARFARVGKGKVVGITRKLRIVALVVVLEINSRGVSYDRAV